MVVARLITMPCAGLVGALVWWLGHVLGGGLSGAVVVVTLLLAVALLLAVTVLVRIRSQHDPVHADDVNDDWDAPRGADRAPAAI